MFDLLRPPTDNLYKFLALSGLAVFLAAGWGSLRIVLDDMRLDRKDTEARLLIGVDLQRIGVAVAKLESDLKLGKLDTSHEKGRIDSLYKDIQGNLSKHIDDVRDTVASKAKLERDNYPQHDLLKLAVWVGIAMTIAGFILWYRRVQRPLDEIMRYDLEERRQKANAAQIQS